MPTIDVRGTPLYYARQGSGPPLLLIHGTGGNADAFAPVLGDLAASYTAIVYDRRAFSRSTGSPHPATNYLASHAADAAALLQGLAAAPADVVGWSAGGLVAMALAVGHPQLVKSLVLYEPPFLVKSNVNVSFALAFVQIMTLRTLGMKQAAARKFYRTVAPRADGADDFDAVPPDLRSALLANAPGLLAELDGGTGEEFDASALRDLAQPISLLTGGQSAPILHAAAARLVKALPVRKHTIAPNAGHFMQITDPKGFVAAVEDLLSHH